MPLSEYEQRVLDELERDLGADPKLKKNMARAPRSSARLVIAGIAVAGGMGVIIAGAVAQAPIVGVIGFAVMLGTVVWALFAPAQGQRAAASAAGKRKGDKKPGFMSRLDERFERRRDQGGL